MKSGWKMCFVGQCLLIVLLAGVLPCAGADDALVKYNVVWESPSKDASGSMPLGNGDIGVNAWVEPSGDLLFYVGKTDAWSENGRLLKVGRLRLHCSPVAQAVAGTFRQELRLEQGEMVVDLGEGDSRQRLRLWVDAHHPVIHVEVDRDVPFEVEVKLESWRQKRRELLGQESVQGGRCLWRQTPSLRARARSLSGTTEMNVRSGVSRWSYRPWESWRRP